MAKTSTKNDKLAPTVRAAAVMVALGADEAAEVYKFLKEDEIERLSLEIAKLDRMEQENMQEIIDDFYGLCVTQKVLNEGGISYARDVLEKAFGAQNEHPQKIALLLSYARADQASQIIAELPRNIQIDIIERIANLESVTPDVIAMVESVLEKRFANIISVDTDRNTEKYIFDELGVNNPELSEEIRKLMFVFEDIINLDSLAIQRFIREVDSKDLAVALKAANEDVKATIMRNMSKRMQETIQGDIQYLHNVRMRDVEEAQQKIVGIIRQLEEAGEIVISKGGEDEIIA